ncbi:putative ATP-dependent helicase HRQ1 [Glarea lozoyensis 74030]|uniref:Putative ATP-dependent helicase HRQ1 n=1 Tax=Glarea lozoyensis (strain ATCC 74030 / MF5533) TaxID=1104152 RepID=H0EER7_GLAL7|nr:putative ATP-dependent helicase HRQ1 [Glarea lozoyensis 74030]
MRETARRVDVVNDLETLESDSTRSTVSNKIVRKRKRKDVEGSEEPSTTLPPSPSTSTTSIPTKLHDGGSKPRRAPKSEKQPPALARSASTFSNPVTSSIPWPASFQTLEKTHKALNVVFTFCSTRKHVVTTFDTIKNAVEGHIKRELKVEEVAKIVALRPGGMNFSYVDEAMLQVEVKGAERDETFKGRKKDWFSQHPAPDASVGGVTGTHGLGHGEAETGAGEEVLYFEFIDGDLKRQVENKKTGEPTKATRKLRDEELKMPVFSQKQMMGLIEKRNTKFGYAINAFLNRCEAESTDAEDTLNKESESFIPMPSKSLIYQIPVLHELERDPNTRAMYIFPTKALAQDQRRSLKEMMRFMTGLEETIVETFDGDTDMKDRNLIRDEGRIIFTNPDMLHITILPQEEKWRTFLKNLKYVVVDEIHVYNGLFGSHVAFIMRRLRRICAAVGNRHIKFISCSATVANPQQHFKTIFGIDDVRMTDFDGSPSGRKEFLCWNTPFKDPGDPSSGRGDTMYEAARLFCQLILRGYYMQNPDEIFTKPNCELQVDLQNMLVLEGHIQCAAFEMPIRVDEDAEYFPKNLKEIAEERMVRDELGFYHCNDRFRPVPSNHGKNVVLEELEASRAFFTLYDGGIFLHQGNSYLVKEFNPDMKLAKVELVRVDWTTQQRDYTDVDPIETEAICQIPKSLSRAFFGTIKIQQVVYGFFKVDKKRRILDAVQVDNPPIIIFSKGMWLDVPKQALDILLERRLNIAGAIHAAEHAILSLMPNFVVSMPGDVRTECKIGIKEFAQKETTRGASGSGISTKAFEFIDLLLKQAIDIDALPMGPEEGSPAGIETVVLAKPVLPKGRMDVLEVNRGAGNDGERTVVGEVTIKDEPLE